MISWVLHCFHGLCKSIELIIKIQVHTYQLSWFFLESPSFLSNLVVSRLEHHISWETPTVAFFKIFSLISLFLRCPKGK